jgi:hypothetical protein
MEGTAYHPNSSLKDTRNHAQHRAQEASVFLVIQGQGQSLYTKKNYVIRAASTYVHEYQFQIMDQVSVTLTAEQQQALDKAKVPTTTIAAHFSPTRGLP